MKHTKPFLFAILFLVSCASPVASVPTFVETLMPATPMMTPVMTQTITQTPSPVATLSLEQQIAAMVNEAKETGIFPSGLSEEQMKLFVEEINRQCGEQILVFPTSNPEYVILNVPQHLYPKFEEDFGDIVVKKGFTYTNHDLWKVYGDFSDNYTIKAEHLTTERTKVLRESLKQEKWVYIKRDPNTNQLVILLNGVLIPIPGSENFTDDELTEAIELNNFDKKVADGEFTPPKIDLDRVSIKRRLESESNNSLVPAILLPIPNTGLTQIVSDERSEDGSYGLIILPMLRIHRALDKNSKEVLIGEVFYSGETRSADFIFLREGEDIISSIRNGEAFRERKFENIPSEVIKELGLYYVMVGKTPQLLLKNVSYADEYMDIVVPPFFTTLDNGSASVLNIKPDLKTDGAALTRTNMARGLILIEMK